MAAQTLGTLAAKTPGESEVLGLDSDALGVDGSEIGILEKRNKISLSSLLQSHDCRRLEAQVRLQMEVRCVSHNAW